jgi:hypothetical protein
VADRRTGLRQGPYGSSSRGDSGEAQLPAASTVAVASLAWAFTQHQPVDTSHLMDEAKRRGLDLDLPTLRELYRYKLFVPFVYVNDRRVGPVPSPVTEEPWPGGTRLQQLRHARDRGRLSDLGIVPFRPRLLFDLPRGRDPWRWWNGFLYSWYQLLICPEIGGLLCHRTRRRTAESGAGERVGQQGCHGDLVAGAGVLASDLVHLLGDRLQLGRAEQVQEARPGQQHDLNWIPHVGLAEFRGGHKRQQARRALVARAQQHFRQGGLLLPPEAVGDGSGD